jgi:nicotinamidase/pyrazinamidase
MKALVITDIQYDFCPGGALLVEEGDQIVPVVNELIDCFELVAAVQEWHPPDHMSFASSHGKKVGEVIILDGIEQILWPDHCAQGSRGAEFLAQLRTDRVERVFKKGTDKRIDSYSGFFDNGHKKATGLGDYLKKKGVDEVYLVGLATDYCIKYSALDAVCLGFTTTVIVDACRGVNLEKEDTDRAIAGMKRAGVRIIRSSVILEKKKLQGQSR